MLPNWHSRNKVPTDDPGDDFARRCVRISMGFEPDTGIIGASSRHNGRGGESGGNDDHHRTKASPPVDHRKAGQTESEDRSPMIEGGNSMGVFKPTLAVPPAATVPKPGRNCVPMIARRNAGQADGPSSASSPAPAWRLRDQVIRVLSAKSLEAICFPVGRFQPEPQSGS